MGAIVARGQARFGDRPAIVEASGATSFAELGARVSRVAGALAEVGARPGDRVVLWLENCAEFLEVEQACFLAGYVRTALSPRLHPAEVAHIVEDCTPTVLVTGVAQAGGLLDLRKPAAGGPVVLTVGGTLPGTTEYGPLTTAAPPVRSDLPLPQEDDVAALLYTSGTTGRPKAAVLTHRNWVAMVSGLLMELPPIGETDVVLHSGPMGHLSGSVGTACYARGAATAMLRKFDPEGVLRAVADLGVTVLPLVPTMLSALVDAAERGTFDLSTLRAVPYGGSAVAPQVLERARAVLGDVLVQVYGLSEALVPLAALSPAAHRRGGPGSAHHLSSAGRPSPFVDVRVLTDDGAEADAGTAGEILVRGDTVMAGYWAKPAATSEVMTADGWLRTGDVGYLAEDGYLYLVDRKRDVIVTGGYNVYPAEVERVIETLPEVHEVVVVGAPDDRWGETVTAVIALKAGAQLSEDRIVEVCRRHLAGYKKPTSVHFVGELPKNSTGKLLRREVRERFWAGRERSVGG